MTTLCFDDFAVGDTELSEEVVADEAEMMAYAQAYDPFPIHTDPEAARRSPYNGIIAPWGYTVGLFFRAVHSMRLNRDARDAFQGGLEWHVRFQAPIRAGDRIRVRTTVTDTRPTRSGTRGLITSCNEIINQQGETCVTIEITSLLAARQ